MPIPNNCKNVCDYKLFILYPLKYTENNNSLIKNIKKYYQCIKCINTEKKRKHKFFIK